MANWVRARITPSELLKSWATPAAICPKALIRSEKTSYSWVARSDW